MDEVKRRDGEIPGTARAREGPPPKFQMSTRTHLTKSLTRSRKVLMKRAKAGDAKAAKMLGIGASTADMTDEEIGAIVPPLSNAAKGIDLADIIDLRKRGLSHGAIGKVLGCTKKNIQKRLRWASNEVDRIENFKTYKGDVLAIHQRRILDSIDQGTIKKAGLRDRVLAFGVLHDKEKMITDKGEGKGQLQINIINYAGASQSGQVTRVEIVPGEQTTQQMAMGD